MFVEPEGLGTDEVYLNGVSSSLPEDVQDAFLRTIPGLENLQIVRPGYAVEYDYLQPTQLFPSLMAKSLDGLFVAGQTNGTSGYEEAAAQGLLAGINAALRLQGKEPLVLSRAEAYIGVMVDDLVTLGTEEPYRLFTSRAEYRLSLRHDTADIRLLPARPQDRPAGRRGHGKTGAQDPRNRGGPRAAAHPQGGGRRCRRAAGSRGAQGTELRAGAEGPEAFDCRAGPP